MAANALYQGLEERFRTIGDLRHAEAMLSWDEAVMMPSGGGKVRADALAALAGTVHSLEAAPDIAELAEEALEQEADLWRCANLRQMLRVSKRARALPEDLVTALTRASAASEQAWRAARGANDFEAVVPGLEEVLGLTRERACALAEAAGDGTEPYDALLDVYEPDLTRAAIDPIFNELRDVLPGLIDRAIANQQAPGKDAPCRTQGGRDALPPETPTGPFPIAAQANLGRTLMHHMGFDFERGRLDVSHHPFCGGEPDDARITTRYDEDDFLKSMFAVLHETGHALYEQGLPRAWRGQPVGVAGGMALHESQSLLMEMQVCRSAPFLAFAAPIVREAFGADEADPTWGAANLARLATRVERSLIRVDADEATYPLHIILRYEMETALLGGSLAVADIPDAWDEKMRAYLGISTAGNFADGCMQDVHWFAGLIGYFPTYTLGAVTAAQLWQAARRALPGVEEAIGGGDFAPLLGWLRENIHSQGRLMSGGELIARATGRRLGTEAFLEHLKARYLGEDGSS